MKKKLRLNIFTDGVLVPMLANIVGRHNSDKEMVSLPEIDMLIFALKTTNAPDYITRTEYGNETNNTIFTLSVFENDVLVCVVEEIEVVELGENVVQQRYHLDNESLLN